MHPLFGLPHALDAINHAFHNIFGQAQPQKRPQQRPQVVAQSPLPVRPAQTQGNLRYGRNLQGSNARPPQPRTRFTQPQGYSPSIMQAGWNMPMNDLEITHPLQGGYADQGNINLMPGRQSNPNYRTLVNVNRASGFNTRQRPNRALEQLLRYSGVDY